jgi:hypothetical protein
MQLFCYGRRKRNALRSSYLVGSRPCKMLRLAPPRAEETYRS